MRNFPSLCLPGLRPGFRFRLVVASQSDALGQPTMRLKAPRVPIAEIGTFPSVLRVLGGERGHFVRNPPAREGPFRPFAEDWWHRLQRLGAAHI